MAGRGKTRKLGHLGMSRIAVCILIFLIGVSVAPAQLPTATILGVVKDSSGAVVPGATLTAHSVETGQTRTATSAADGSYRFSALPVGAYEVRAENPGFQVAVRSGLVLTVSQEAVVNFALEVGAVSQTVAVTAEAPMVNTTSGSLGGLVGEQTISDLPLNGRNYQSLTLLQMGITQYQNYTTSPINSAGYNGILYSSNGAGFRSNYFMLDGASLANAWGGTSASTSNTTLGVDGIREYRVVTNSSSAEYGMTMGSQMIMVSKSGSNKFHGDVFEYLRNNDLDARNFFDYSTALSSPGYRLPAFQRNNFGASVGGPIKKDKTFFYGVFEEVTARTGVTTISGVPAAGCHNAVAGVPITAAQCSNLGAASATMAPQMAPILALYPNPNLVNNQYTFPYTNPETDYFGQMRVDHSLSTNDTLFARYTIENSSQAPVINFPAFYVNELSRGQYSTLSETHIFSPTVLNTARFSFSRSWVNEQSPNLISGPQYDFTPGVAMGYITISSLANTNFGNSGLTPLLFTQNIFTWSDDAYYTKGRHSFKFGALVNHFQHFYNSQNAVRGSISFPTVAGFLTATPTSYNIEVPGLNNQYRAFHENSMGFYVQDDVRLNSRLNLNVGFRYEPTTQMQEVSGHSSGLVDVQHDTQVTPGVPPFLNPSLHNFSPRFGFAWDVMGDGKTSVRGGAALLYDVSQWQSLLGTDVAAMPPYSEQITVAQPAAGVISIPLKIPALSAIPLPSIAFKLPDYNMKQPHMLTYNLTLERQLPGNMALSLGYAGSRGINIIFMDDGNPTIPGGVPVNGACVPRATGTAYNINAPSCWLPNNPPLYTANPRTNPNFGPILYQNAGGNSFYNSLQFGLTKRLSHGLQFQSSYTWSKSIDDTQGQIQADASGTAPVPSDPVHRNVDRSVSTFDATQNWRLNTIYNLPKVSSLTGVAGKLVNGWWMSGILSLQTGLPFSASISANPSNSLTNGGNQSGSAGTDRPNLVVGRSNSNITSGTSTGCTGVAAGTALGTPNLWFDPCAFTAQVSGFLGTAGRDILRGPGLANLDFSLVKDTALKFLGESGSLQFRVEVFNILNHANFNIPNPNLVFTGLPAGSTPVVSSSTGVITSTSNTSRQIQLALKIIF